MTPDRVAAALTPETSVVSVSAVDFRTGYRADLAALREVAGDRLLVVDGIQGFGVVDEDRKSTRLNSSHVKISYAVFCLKKKKNKHTFIRVGGNRSEE